mmetsp:Transcript_7245/g.24007  ORF Transcript_7245/g.24007 Transcript_7245/m.24007 type:complete len:326 (-) Transcript_7245:1242-2219(-)
MHRAVSPNPFRARTSRKGWKISTLFPMETFNSFCNSLVNNTVTSYSPLSSKRSRSSFFSFLFFKKSSSSSSTFSSSSSSSKMSPMTSASVFFLCIGFAYPKHLKIPLSIVTERTWNVMPFSREDPSSHSRRFFFTFSSNRSLLIFNFCNARLRRALGPLPVNSAPLLDFLPPPPTPSKNKSFVGDASFGRKEVTFFFSFSSLPPASPCFCVWWIGGAPSSSSSSLPVSFLCVVVTAFLGNATTSMLVSSSPPFSSSPLSIMSSSMSSSISSVPLPNDDCVPSKLLFFLLSYLTFSITGAGFTTPNTLSRVEVGIFDVDRGSCIPP